MRTLAVTALLLLVLAVPTAQAQSAEDGRPASEVTGYLPADASFATLVSTGALLGQLGDATARAAVEAELRTLASDLGLEYERELRPLLGGDVVVGAQSPQLDSLVFAGRVPDPGALLAAVSSADRARPAGEVLGARVFVLDADAFVAVEGDEFVLAESRGALEIALSQREAGGGLTVEELDRRVGSTPEGAFVRAYYDLGAALAAEPSSAAVRSVPWIGAIRTVGLSLGADAADASAAVSVNTDASRLT